MEASPEEREARPRRKWLWIGCLVLGVPATGVLLLAGWILVPPIYQNWSHSRGFDAQVWRGTAEDSGMWPVRLCMVDDLLRSRRLLGMSRSEVIELLGPPAEPGFPGGARGTALHYFLGPERGFFRIDSEWLLIGTDSQGAVDAAWLYSD